jgi:hypothetical protein
VRKRGVEPLPLAGLDPKSSASANSATFAGLVFNKLQPDLNLRVLYFPSARRLCRQDRSS